MSEEQKHTITAANTTESGENAVSISHNILPSTETGDDSASESVPSVHAAKDIKLSHGAEGADAIALTKAELTKETVWKCKEAINIAAGSNMKVSDPVMSCGLGFRIDFLARSWSEHSVEYPVAVSAFG